MDRMPGRLIIDEIVGVRLGQDAADDDPCRNSDHSREPSVFSEYMGAADLAERPRKVVGRSVTTNPARPQDAELDLIIGEPGG
jgi:hypothetical protein